MIFSASRHGGTAVRALVHISRPPGAWLSSGSWNVRFDEDGLSASARARSHLSRSLRRLLLLVARFS